MATTRAAKKATNHRAQRSQQQPVPAQVVGNAFARQYYHILHQSPGLVHRFYQDISKLGRVEDDGTMSITTTMDAINVKILSLNYDDIRAEIKSVDAQESLDGGVNVLVTGYLTGKDDILRSFAQSFFLAPQYKGYFVLNDIFRYMENATIQQGGNQVVAKDVEAPAMPEQATETVPVQENHVSEQEPVVVEEEANGEAVANPSDSEVVEDSVVEEEVPVPEVIDEVQVASPVVIETNVKPEDAPKKTYASIAKDLLRFRKDEENRLREEERAKEEALAIAEMERAKCKEAIEIANAAQRIAKKEAKMRKIAERRAIVKEAEVKMMLEALNSRQSPAAVVPRNQSLINILVVLFVFYLYSATQKCIFM